ncbi:MAG: SirB1 family protein [Methanocella sp.]
MVQDTEQAWARMMAADATASALAEGALLIAAHEYPDLDIEASLRQLQSMADTLRRRLRPDISPSETVIALNHYLFDELGFRGNAADYYDPRNSYLNEVMERRLGIPISLSVLYIDVGRRLGLALDGISFPSHFLVKCTLRTGVLVLDPFCKGASLSADELRRRLGEGALPQSDAELLGTTLRTASVPEILARMLRNLRAIYLHHKALEKALWAADRIVTLLPGVPAEYRERGRIYLELECFRAALTDFRSYAALAPQAADAEGISAAIAELQRRAARLN